MNRYEGITACAVIAVFAMVLLVRFVFEVVRLLLSNCVAFLSLAPPWFWGLAIGVAVLISIIGFALWMLHLNTKMRHEAAVVHLSEENAAIVFHEGGYTALSFGGRQITSKQIVHSSKQQSGHRKLPSEVKILKGRWPSEV